MKPIPITTAQFDSRVAELQALTRDWAGREAVSFDDAVGCRPQNNDGSGSIWDMPTIDSKRVVALLVELETKLGCRLPCALIKRGGYSSPEELSSHLLSRIRENCSDANGPGVAATSPPLAPAAAVTFSRVNA
jgi:hypothetical protein